MKVLVTGGTGYIGAHVIELLLENGHSVVVVDDLKTGDSARIAPIVPIQINLADDQSIQLVSELITTQRIDAVIHLAARKQVSESILKPAWYFRENVGGLANLLMALDATGVNKLVFSSSAAVYGEVDGPPVSEGAKTFPVNPYGETKLVGEKLVAACAVSQGLRAISLRYFNVAGASRPELGDTAVLNLVPMVFQKLDDGCSPEIFGGDYETRDGTCVRDFIHVSDLARAHLTALEALDSQSQPGHSVFNVGTGEGTSVREMVALILQVADSNVGVDMRPRRPGDAASVVANVDSIERNLQWTSEYGAREIVESAWASHQYFKKQR